MPGLMDEKMMGGMTGDMQPANGAAMPAEEQGETVPDDEGAEQASPEEQAKYEEFVKTAFGFMYKGGKVNPGILKMLDDDPSDLMQVLDGAEELKQFSPVVALAATAAILTLKACEETGEKDGAIILHGGQAILEELVELAGKEKAGIRDYSEEEMGQAMHMGADLFRHAAEKSGIVDVEEAKKEWGEIETADKEGRLGDVIPQFAGAEQAQAQQPEQQPQEMPGG